MLVFVPLSPGSLRALADGRPVTAALAWAVTPDFVAATGYTPDEAEEAEHEALLLASLDAFTRHGLRLVAVAETAATPAADPAVPGEVTVPALSWRQVTAFFADDPAESASIAAAAALVGQPLPAALDSPVTPDLMAVPLLWYDKTELDRTPITLPTTTGLVTL
ncbi:MAG: hypothetical protein LBR33_10400 [Propionibacteriaceae bacterium]|jgi:hypothetical protein|nr:hypothetical protein [Propionibacteriaceae bacterium]